MGYIMGCVNPPYRSTHYDTLRRQRTRSSTYARPNTGCDNTYHQGTGAT